MSYSKFNVLLFAITLAAFSTANADYGVGFKAGTLGLGVEGRWSPVPWLDVRVGANQYDYEYSGSQAGIEYDGLFAMESYYVTGNFRFPLSPFRVTAGAFANGNALLLTNQDTGGSDFVIGGDQFNAVDVGSLQSATFFSNTSPYLGVGYDFEVFGKLGLNFDFGVLWQGEPIVFLQASGLANAPAQVQALLIPALELERQELEDDLSNLKAWPVLTLGFVYNF